MAIVYPRELPGYVLSVGNITFDDNVVFTPSDKGMVINATQFAEPTAKINVTTGLLYPDQVRRWRTWKDSLRGGLQHFVAYDVRYKAPQAYPNPTKITAAVSGLTRSTISLSGMPANYIMTEGDLIGLEQNGRFGYYKALETIIGTSGGAVVVPVYPFVHTAYFTNAAVARLVKPKAKFVLDWSSWDEPQQNEPGAISFTGAQRI